MDQWVSKFMEELANPWVILGFGGQALFFSRWVIQWIASEKKKESVVPLAFWYISLLGGICLLVYSIHKKDPVFMLGQMIGVANYTRNIFLIRRSKGIP